MTELKEFLEKNIEEGFQRILISNARKREGASKLQVRPVLLKGQLWYQVTRTEGTKEIHKNYGKEELISCLCTEMGGKFPPASIGKCKSAGDGSGEQKRQNEHKNKSTECTGKEQGGVCAHAFS